MKEKRIAFVGPKEYAKVMRFAGFECFGVLSEDEAKETIKNLEEENYALIFVSQDVCPKEVAMDRIVVLPGVSKKEEDSDYLKKEINKALGGDYDI